MFTKANEYAKQTQQKLNKDIVSQLERHKREASSRRPKALFRCMRARMLWYCGDKVAPTNSVRNRE